MEHYVTLFDSLFLPQGMALHLSMERHIGTYTLWILCVDDDVHRTLSKLAMPNVRLLQLTKLETPELLVVKHERTGGEYCWTLTPFAPRFVFETDLSVNRVTYLDADMWFRKNPYQIFDELNASGKDVLITDHAFSPEGDYSALAGQYCVQFMTFTRLGGEVVRKWWEDRCIEWCFSRYENGKFGDQKYLDDWPTRFANHVHVLSNKELTLAPWNATRFPYGNAVTWHFQSLRILKHSKTKYSVEYGAYLLPRCTRDMIYKPYLADLRESIDKFTKVGVALKAQKPSSLLSYIQMRMKMLYQRLWIFNTGYGSRL